MPEMALCAVMSCEAGMGWWRTDLPSYLLHKTPSPSLEGSMARRKRQALPVIDIIIIIVFSACDVLTLTLVQKAGWRDFARVTAWPVAFLLLPPAPCLTSFACAALSSPPACEA